MALTGNKGEWSEIYTLLKLLGEGKVYAGDQNLNKIQDLFYPIIMILRQEKDGNYNYRLQDKDVVIQTPAGEELLRIPASVFLVEAENLLKAINENDGAFGVPQIEVFMNSIYCHSLKAKSSDKTDIRIILHDRRTKINSEMGFSIKSQLGGDSTLLNASKVTNFNFKVTGANLSDDEITAINSINPKRNKVIERVNAIKKKGALLVFDKVDNSTFRNNLVMLDGDLPAIIANLLLEQLNTGVSTLKEFKETFNAFDVKKVKIGRNITLNPFLKELSESGKWRASDYSWYSNNCQQFTAKCAEILNLTRSNPSSDDWTEITPSLLNILQINENKK